MISCCSSACDRRMPYILLYACSVFISMDLQTAPEKQCGSGLASCSARPSRLPLFISFLPTVPLTKFQKPLFPRACPGSQFDRLLWADGLWKYLLPDQRDRLIRNLQVMRWKDLFAGLGSRSQLITQIVHAVNKNIPNELMIPATHSITEMDGVRRAIPGNVFKG